jgi:hypothetical protein
LIVQILSHRGWWNQPAEKNTPAAFARSFAAGFGTETDLRDLQRRLVISHDPPADGAWTAEEFFALHAQLGPGLPLALNVKADGLQSLFAECFSRYGLAEAFLFDMSVPDALVYHRRGLPFFTRQSELEPQPALYREAQGVWLDSFFDEAWIIPAVLDAHLAAGKRLCLVSPELHGRDPARFWEQLYLYPARADSRLLLCTDRPDEAQRLGLAAA